MKTEQWRVWLNLGTMTCFAALGCAGVQGQPDQQAVISTQASQAGKPQETPPNTAGESVLALPREMSPIGLNPRQRQVCENLGLDPNQLAELINKPLYKFNEPEVDVYLHYLSAYEPDLRKRVAHLARKNIGQPYEIYLLGEMPFELYDPQPLYCLSKSDCLVFSEHTYAMALTDNWSSFMRMLQRIRYKDGQIGVATRNHYTEADWDPNNRWLVQDITEELAPEKVMRFKQKIDRAKFLRKRYGLETDIPVEETEQVFLRYEDIDLAKPHLRDGDFVNVVRGIPAAVELPDASGEQADSQASLPASTATEKMQGIFGGNAWVGHTGLIVLGEDGEVHFIHSSEPKVREEPIDDYIARSTAHNAEKDAAGKARLLGFKFLRLRDDPWENLRELDGDAAPRVTLPGGMVGDSHALPDKVKARSENHQKAH